MQLVLIDWLSLSAIGRKSAHRESYSQKLAGPVDAKEPFTYSTWLFPPSHLYDQTPSAAIITSVQ